MKTFTRRIVNLLHSRHDRPVYTIDTAEANKPDTVQIIISASGQIQKPPLFSRITNSCNVTELRINLSYCWLLLVNGMIHDPASKLNYPENYCIDYSYRMNSNKRFNLTHNRMTV